MRLDIGRGCKLHLEELKKKRSKTSASGIFVIEINMSTNLSWVFNTGCGAHICIDLQGLRNS